MATSDLERAESHAEYRYGLLKEHMEHCPQCVTAGIMRDLMCGHGYYLVGQWDRAEARVGRAQLADNRRKMAEAQTVLVAEPTAEKIERVKKKLDS